MTLHGYIHRGISGWSVAWWDGQQMEWIFGISTWDEAFEVLKGFW
jgi:hypothetical protein